MGSHGYKKYMKKDAQKDNPFLKIFLMAFFGMLLIFTFLIKSFSPTVDTTIGDYKVEVSDEEETKKIVDDRLAMIQSEDQGRNFSDLMTKPDDVDVTTSNNDNNVKIVENKSTVSEALKEPSKDTVYKVYIGSYTSEEQAKVAKDIILDSGNGLTPIVKCIGTNNYTLQVGIFKNKQSADGLLRTVQQNNLPGRIVQDY
jgi:hypothetical protein